MTQIILFGLMIFVVMACENTKKPEGLLSEQQMVSAMTELYLAEEQMNRLAIPYDSMKKIFPMFSERAFEKAKVSDSIFKMSLDYYMTQPEKLDDIYTTLVDSLNLKAQRAGVKKKDVAPA